MSFIKPKLIGDIPNKLGDVNKQVIVYVDKFGINLENYDHYSYEYKIYWQIESRGVLQGNENNITFPIKNKSNFDLILANDPQILKECENSIVFPFGDCWIKDGEQKIYDKSKMLSIIVSEKQFLPGHQLRHNVISSIGDKMDIYGRCCNYIENKVDALKDYKFSICIENSKIDNWFTEKLIDCFKTGTVPIYWGCPNIGDYFNTDGFIIVNSLDEIINVVNNLSDEQYYSKMSYIEENFNKSSEYGSNLFERVDKEIKRLING